MNTNEVRDNQVNGNRANSYTANGNDVDGLFRVVDRPFHYVERHFKNCGFEDVPQDEDAPRRIMASNFAAAFDALVHASGIAACCRDGLHILLNMTRGFGPGEWVSFGDASAGSLLPGDEDVTRDSKAKRWKRFWKDFEEEQKRLGKRIAYREPGKTVQRTKFDEPKLKPSRYKSYLAQVIVNIDREVKANKNRREYRRLTRQQRYEKAAVTVFNLLPEYDEQTTRRIKMDRPETNKPVKTRCMNRLHNTVQEMLADAGDGEEYRKRCRQIKEEINTLLGEDTIDMAGDTIRRNSDATCVSFESANLQNIEQNDNFFDLRVDSNVTSVDAFPEEHPFSKLTTEAKTNWMLRAAKTIAESLKYKVEEFDRVRVNILMEQDSIFADVESDRDSELENNGISAADFENFLLNNVNSQPDLTFVLHDERNSQNEKNTQDVSIQTSNTFKSNISNEGKAANDANKLNGNGLHIPASNTPRTAHAVAAPFIGREEF